MALKMFDSASRYFLPGHQRHFFLLTNLTTVAKAGLTVLPIEDRPWPYPTLKRFHYHLQHRSFFDDFDYVFHCDADMRFVSTIGEEIIPMAEPLVGRDSGPGRPLGSKIKKL